MAGFEPSRPVEPDASRSTGAGTGADGGRADLVPADDHGNRGDGGHADEARGDDLADVRGDDACGDRGQAGDRPGTGERPDERPGVPNRRRPAGEADGEAGDERPGTAASDTPAPGDAGPGEAGTERAGPRGLARALRGLVGRGLVPRGFAGRGLAGRGVAGRAGADRRDRPGPRQRRGEFPADPGGRPVTGRLGPGAERPEAGPGVPGGAHGEPSAQETETGAPDPVFQHGVVVGFDGSLSSERALAYAVGMARRSQCGLVIVHVANRLPATVWAGCEPPVFVDLPDHRTEVLGLELACADFLSGVPWILIERGGDICHEIEEVGREYAADAIVVGTTHGLLGKIFGSVSGRLARRANRPVIVIP